MMGINANPLETLSLTQKKAMVTLMDLLLTETNLSAIFATIHIARSRGQPFSTNDQLVMNKLAQYLAYSIKNLEYKKHKILFETKGEGSDLNPLTVRELEVLHLVADGLRDTDIADQLGISVYTVKEHLKRIYAKLKVSSRLQAVIKAFNLELI